MKRGQMIRNRQKIAWALVLTLLLSTLYGGGELKAAAGDKKFYLDALEVLEIEDESSVTGKHILIGEKEFELDDAGKLVIDSADTGILTDGGRPYLETNQEQLEIRINDHYFTQSVAAADTQTEKIALSFLKKYTFFVKAKKQISKSAAVELNDGVDFLLLPKGEESTSQIKEENNQYCLSRGEYLFCATWQGLTYQEEIRVDKNSGSTQTLIAEFRNYIRYGKTGDFYITKDGLLVEDSGDMFRGDTLVIPENQTPDAQNPYSACVVEKTEDGITWTDCKTVNAADSLALQDGWYRLRMTGGTIESYDNREFKIDNGLPKLIDKKWKKGNSDSWQALDKNSIPNLELMDQEKIFLQFTVEDSNLNGGDEEFVLFLGGQGGEDLTFVPQYAKSAENNRHGYTFELSGDMIKRNLNARITDMAGNTVECILYADVIVDGKAPKVEKVEKCIGESPDQMHYEIWDQNTEAFVNGKISLRVVVTEDNPSDTAMLKYKPGKDTVEKTVVSDSFDPENRAYYFSLEPGEVESYRNVTFEVKDRLGNTDSSLWGNIIQDNTDPKFESIKRKASESEFEKVNSGTILVDQADITLRVSVTEPHLKTVSLTVDGSDKEISKKAADAVKRSGDTWEFDFVITKDNKDLFYKDLVFKAEDAAGNSAEFAPEIRVIIDSEGPALKEPNPVVANVNEETGGWYSKVAKEPLRYTFTIQDHAALKSIALRPSDGSKGDIKWEFVCSNIEPSASENYRLITENADHNGRDAETGLFTYQVMTDCTLFENAADQQERYDLILVDKYDHKNTYKEVIELKIDNTKPEEKAYINFKGDKNLFYGVDGNIIEDISDSYMIGEAAEGVLYNQEYVALNIYMRDAPGKNAIHESRSQIYQVTVNLDMYDSVHEDSPTMQEVQTLRMSFPEEGTISEVKLDLGSEGKTELLDMQKVTLQISVEAGAQKIAGIRSVVIKDAAGNETVVENPEGVAIDKVKYVVDHAAPKISDHFPVDEKIGYEKDGIYYYRAKNPEIYVEIEENNFYPEDVKDMAVSEEIKMLEGGVFSFKGNSVYRRNYKPDSKMADGTYQFGFSYSDRSSNQMVEKEEGEEKLVGTVSEGTYLSPLIVLDTKPPVVEVRYYKGSRDITADIARGRCYDGDIRVVIKVVEENFNTDKEHVTIDFSGQSAKDNSEIRFDYDPENWEQEKDAKDRFTYTFFCTEEGRYTIDVKCVDNAGNVSNKVKNSNFTIDRTSPKAEVSYDVTQENGYYNTDRVATITVTEKNFSADDVSYHVITTGPQPDISEWHHSGANGCSGGNHVNGCKWRATARFSRDGDYAFSFQCTDKAGHSSGNTGSQTFTIDKTIPEITVNFDNKNAKNGSYYNMARMVTITVHEHNFDERGVEIRQSTTGGMLNPVSAWRSIGIDTYMATIVYNADGEYHFDIAYTDKAGNRADDYGGEQFVIDLTAPVLEIRDVEDHSANNGTVRPKVVCRDRNFDKNNVKIRITGVNTGEIKLESEIVNTVEGQSIQYTDFPHTQETDDLYTLKASVTDLAGNVTEDSILFSVNRFGSVYIFGGVDQYYVSHGPDLTVTEINVDLLEFQEITYSRDGDIVTLIRGEDYTVKESGNAFQWKQYVYEIDGDNFEQEGVYVVTIQSEDRATNDSSNRLKGSNIEFTVDKTAPSVVLAGVENHKIYNADRKTITVDAKDNIYLQVVEIYLDNEVLQSFDEIELFENDGVVSCDVRESDRYRTLSVIARDAAGNYVKLEPISFLLTSNVFIRLIHNKLLLIILLIGVIIILAGFNGILLYKRRKRR